MHVRFLRDRNWSPPEERRITVAYKQDMELTVKRAWGEQLVADGDAVEITPPRRGLGGSAAPFVGDGERGGEVFTPDREPGSSVPARRPLSPAQIERNRDGTAAGSLPKAKR